MMVRRVGACAGAVDRDSPSGDVECVAVSYRTVWGSSELDGLSVRRRELSGSTPMGILVSSQRESLPGFGKPPRAQCARGGFVV
jgi:hypothetical protein